MMDEMEAAMWRDMNMSMNGMEPSWTAIDAALLFVMWSAMMAAMMVPGASPMVAAFATINRRRRQRSAPYVPTAVFLLGYLIVWAGFSVVATALQWLLQATGLLTTMMQSASHYWSAALFLAAGLYQFSPLKERCLAYCRTPDSFILSEWRDGALGARSWACGTGCSALAAARPYGAAVRSRGHGLALGRSSDRLGDRREAPAWSAILASCHRYRSDGGWRGFRNRRRQGGVKVDPVCRRGGAVRPYRKLYGSMSTVSRRSPGGLGRASSQARR